MRRSLPWLLLVCFGLPLLGQDTETSQMELRLRQLHIEAELARLAAEAAQYRLELAGLELRMHELHAQAEELAGLMQPHTGAPHWSYQGPEGPEHWAELSPEFALAREGHEQSPVDLHAAHTTELPEPQIAYQNQPLDLVNNGHTLMMRCQPGSTVALPAGSFELLQFHFHTPSEHTLHGVRFPLEAHLVHRDADGRLAVLGVLVQEGDENPLLAALLAHLPRDVGEELQDPTCQLNPADLLPDERKRFHYRGSLTTPPCTEGVDWTVFQAPLEASPEQIDALREVMHFNARPVQPLHHRVVETD